MADTWCWTNLIDDDATTMTATGTVAGFPPSNIGDPRVGRVWRNATGGGVYITFGAPKRVDVLGVFGGDMQPGHRWIIGMSANATGGYEFTREYIPEIAEGSRQWVFWMANLAGPTLDPATIRRITVIPMDSREIGRIWAGPADWTTSVSHMLGSEFGMVDLGGKQVVPRSGAIIPSRASKRRTHSPRYDALSEAEVTGEARRMDRMAGATAQVLFLPDPEVYETSEYAVLGYLRELNPITTAGWQRFEREYTILETG